MYLLATASSYQESFGARLIHKQNQLQIRILHDNSYRNHPTPAKGDTNSHTPPSIRQRNASVLHHGMSNYPAVDEWGQRATEVTE